ncbi:MAG: helix-turn-helix domain-containing protein [Candidatus Peregrinibacteria bacterium]|nr:helix-turn-helix domain-containing protein [Candidatus Peregrinibacteria bacterium]
MEEKFLTTDQVAQILQVHPFTILKFLKEGKLNGIKLGRVYRIKKSDVEEFIEERMMKKPKKEHKAAEVVKEEVRVEESEDGHYFVI